MTLAWAPAPGGFKVGGTLSHYRIVERLGAGGMGEVYHARDTPPKRNASGTDLVLLENFR